MSLLQVPNVLATDHTSDHSLQDENPRRQSFRQSIIREQAFSRHFLDYSNASARAIYLKKFIGGCFLVSLVVFAIFSIFWGSLWKSPVKKLDGWVVVSDMLAFD